MCTLFALKYSNNNQAEIDKYEDKIDLNELK